MGQTIIEKIISRHSDHEVRPGQAVDMGVDVRAARDFGGANVVKNLQRTGLTVADPGKTLFTFDCNPGGSDQGYAANQQFCRSFARETGVGLRDITAGIGTHIAIEDGLVGPGSTFVSTDSHANIMGAVCAFGQGMGDQDIAYAWASGKVWFKVPRSARVLLRGLPGPQAAPKDIVLAMLRQLGAGGLLGYAAEIYGPVLEELGLAARITIASMATEMGGIIALFPPSSEIIDACSAPAGRVFEPLTADPDAEYATEIEIDISGIGPMIARPGHPEDVVPVPEVAGRKIDSVFIGSCTNGRIEDLRAAAALLRGRKVAPGVVLKVVPATRQVWQQALDEGLVADLMAAGALIGNAGCGGCAAGQIGQNGPGEVTISTGNRNYAGKQGKGEVYLASPETAAASALAGVITSADAIPEQPVLFARPAASVGKPAAATAADAAVVPARAEKPMRLHGRAWVIAQDNIDTDMIFHNRYLAITDLAEMGQYAFDNLLGWEDFATRVKPGDIVVTGANFGCGSSRQQAVDCFKALGVQAIVAQSFGAIYERNAINAGLPVLNADLLSAGLESEQEITVDLESGRITWEGGEVQGEPFSSVQAQIYQRGGLLAAG
jgi:homoaconitate hydratase family protein/3-isopropylmalate dehydratase small subunit